MVKLISCNIEGKKHLKPRVLPFLADEKPDVLCLQEVRQADVSQIEAAAGVTGQFVPMADVATPTWFIDEAQGEVGIYIGSKFAHQELGAECYFGSPENLPIPDINHIDHNFWNRYLAWTIFNKDDQQYAVVTTHFTYALGGGVNDLQRQHLRKILKITNEKLPAHILVGDFNAPRGGEIFTELSQQYTDNIPLEIETTLDENLHRDGKITLVVDGLFSQPEYKVSNVRVVSGVSDHMALVAEVARVSQ